jgi:hypothetical protein
MRKYAITSGFLAVVSAVFFSFGSSTSLQELTKDFGWVPAGEPGNCIGPNRSSSGPPPGWAGSPVGSGTCQTCHIDYAVNSGIAQVNFSGVTQYTPGQTYTITVGLTPTQALDRNGFQLVALRDSDSLSPGAITITDATNTQLLSGGGFEYVEHTYPGSSFASWSFDWTAPATDEGAITFFVAWNDASNSLGQNLDYTYVRKYKISTGPPPTCSTMTASAAITDVLCNGANTGAIDLTVTGGTGPYDYYWSDGSTIGEDVTGLTAGTYNVYVADFNGCDTTFIFTVNEPSALAGSTSSTDELTGNDGTASVVASGGTSPYTYLWDDAGAQTTATATGLVGGNYNVIVTDANGCTAQYAVAVNSSVGLQDNTTSNASVNVYPNPATNQFTLACNGFENTQLNIHIYNAIGKLMYTETVIGSASTQSIIVQTEKWARGTYLIHITDNNSTRIQKVEVR